MLKSRKNRETEREKRREERAYYHTLHRSNNNNFFLTNFFVCEITNNTTSYNTTSSYLKTAPQRTILTRDARLVLLFLFLSFASSSSPSYFQNLEKKSVFECTRCKKCIDAIIRKRKTKRRQKSVLCVWFWLLRDRHRQPTRKTEKRRVDYRRNDSIGRENRGVKSSFEWHVV